MLHLEKLKKVFILTGFVLLLGVKLNACVFSFLMRTLLSCPNLTMKQECVTVYLSSWSLLRTIKIYM